MPTGIGAVDEVLQGGLPVGALTEMIGAECSGRTALALAFVAQVTRAEKVCAWVDVSNALSPESAAAAGVDLARLLWVRCGVVRSGSVQPSSRKDGGFSVPRKYFVPKPVVKGLHGGGMGGHPRGEAKGMDDAVSGLLGPEVTAARCAEPQRRVRTEREVFEPTPLAQFASSLQRRNGGASVSSSPWFRYRAAAERTQTSVLLLTQYACSKSSAGLVLRFQSGDAFTQGATVLAGFERRIEVSRQRLAQAPESQEKVVLIRKPPQRAGVATWRSKTTWAERR
jgi:hypothetical protein